MVKRAGRRNKVICVSLSDSFARFCQVLTEVDSFSIEFVRKRSLPFKFEPSNQVLSFSNELQRLFQEISGEAVLPDKELSISIPSNFFDIIREKVDLNLPESDIEKVLNWNLDKRYGESVSKKFVQHYPISVPSELVFRNFISVACDSEFLNMVTNSVQLSGLDLKLVDLNIFSTCNAIERIYPVSDLYRWGVWEVGDKSQQILMIESDEFMQYIEFDFLDGQRYLIKRRSSGDNIGEVLISELNKVKSGSIEKIGCLNRLYIYSYDIESDLFNLLLTSQISNIEVVNPFLTNQPIELYKDDGESIGAMSQFIDLMGLSIRDY